MPQFKLYESLSKNLKQVQSQEDLEFIAGIKLSPDNLEIIYCLIIHHFIVTHRSAERALETLDKHFQSKRSKKFVFDGERLAGGKGFIFDLKKLPSILQNIIYSYLREITSLETSAPASDLDDWVRV